MANIQQIKFEKKNQHMRFRDICDIWTSEQLTDVGRTSDDQRLISCALLT